MIILSLINIIIHNKIIEIIFLQIFSYVCYRLLKDNMLKKIGIGLEKFKLTSYK